MNQFDKEGRNNMTTYKAYQEGTPLKEVFFKLVTNSTGVVLVAVNADGVPHAASNILTLNNAGRIVLAGSVNKNLGLKIDPSTGKVEVQ